MGSLFKNIDGSLPLATILYNDEEAIISQDGVGLYDGKEKTPNRQNGTIQLTSHRLLYIDHASPKWNSLTLALRSVKQSEYYAGFLTSSPKVTIVLTSSDLSSSVNISQPQSQSGSENENIRDEDEGHRRWICPVCSFSNPPSASDGQPTCNLCGVMLDDRAIFAASATVSSPSFHPLLHKSPSLPSLPSASSEIACPACTYLNHPSMSQCEMCGTSLPTLSKAAKSKSGVATPNPMARDGELPQTNTLRISFRKGGDKAFYAKLKTVLLRKAWETVGLGRASEEGNSTSRSGIQGIFTSVTTSAQRTSTNMSTALQDLETLRIKAGAMASLASSLNAKLSALESTTRIGEVAAEPEEATFIRSSLARLGLPMSAVTLDMVRDEEEWKMQLARELAGILQGFDEMGKGKGIMGGSESIIGLDEVWCGWNRARGVALLPPSSLLLSLPHIPQYTNPPVHLRVFQSGLRVLHTPRFASETFASHLLHLLSSPASSSTANTDAPATHTFSFPGKSTLEIAAHESISVGLAQEMIEAVEIDQGTIVRDEGGPSGETVWFADVLVGWVWDGLEVSD